MRTKKEIREAREKCKHYIRHASTLDGARKRAAREGVRFNTSMWLAAFAEMLEQERKP